MNRPAAPFARVLHRASGAVLPRLGLRQRLLLRAGREWVRRRFDRPAEPVYGLGAATVSRSARRALISYMARALTIPEDDPRLLDHPSFWRTRELVRILNAMDYVVDVVDCTDLTFVPRREYDLFIGHGGFNFERIAATLAPQATTIYFFSGCRWEEHNRLERARFKALEQRRGTQLPLDRFVTRSEQGALLMAHGLMGVGNAFARQTFAGFRSVHTIPGAIAPDDWYESAHKDFGAGRNHFLFFAGPGNVHKGLDRLLEAFDRLDDQELWICTRIEPAFAQAYGNLLRRRRHIHLIEWVQIRSCAFYALLRRCNWTILPSCAEGVAASVVECMQQGLIPIISEACGVDVSGCGVLLRDCTVKEIASAIVACSGYSPGACERLSRSARRRALEDHSRETCSRRMRQAIEAIVREKAARGQVPVAQGGGCRS